VAVAAGLLVARTSPLAALTFVVIVAVALVLLDFRERDLDRRIGLLEQQIAELVGYR
jgi:protein-S-isoprenylcysteine O-methyltransferase Ste14